MGALYLWDPARMFESEPGGFRVKPGISAGTLDAEVGICGAFWFEIVLDWEERP